MITKETLQKVFPHATKANIDKYYPYLIEGMEQFEINTPPRVRMFLAQIGHESGELRYVKELASGQAYEGRTDLGNWDEGDGIKYKGRGLIQITGAKNYTLLLMSLDVDLINNPEYLESPEFAVKSACWYWWNERLNSYADAEDLRGCTKRINGGYNGMEDRERLYNLAKKYI